MAGTAEVVISPRSRLIGETIGSVQFRQSFEVNALGLHQDGKTYYRELADRPLRSGDAIFIQGTWERIHAFQGFHQNFIVISALESEFQQPEKMNRALVCFLSLIYVVILVAMTYFFYF